MRYVAALPGETTECVCHGLLQVFGRMGMAPRVLVFDNATGVGHRNADGTVTQARLFSLFSAHYGFETRFCNPYAGHEKGSVENAVGFVRRNLMVPEPAAEGMGRADARVAGRVRRDRTPGALPPGRADTRPVRDRFGPHAPVAGHAIRSHATGGA